jgi:hypothetical protein
MFAIPTVPSRRMILAAWAAVAVSGLVLLFEGSGQAPPSAQAENRASPAAAKPAARHPGDAVPSEPHAVGRSSL